MPKKQNPKEDNRSLRKAFLFLAVVVILVSLSILSRIVYLVKESNFNGRNRFTIVVIASRMNAHIVSFNPSDKSISDVLVSGKGNAFNPGKILGVPVDGVIELKNESSGKNNSASGILFYTLINPKVYKKNINIVDIIRLYIFSKTVSANNYTKDSITISETETIRDKVAQRLMTDYDIVNEQKSVEIINGTNIDGLGKRLERIIRNSGGNIVAVSNTQETVRISKIYSHQDHSYTQQKLQKILGYPIMILRNREIADVKIVIGTDGIRDEVF